MANAGRGYGRPVDHDSGLLQVLTAYVTRGGRLFAARRSLDNPLTLTHLLWEGPDGSTQEAVRLPDEATGVGGAEQDVWVQLALSFPSSPSLPSGPQSPWQLLTPERNTVMSWITVVRHGQHARQSYPAEFSSYSQGSPNSRPISFDPLTTSQAPWGSSAISGGPAFGTGHNDFPFVSNESQRQGHHSPSYGNQTTAPSSGIAGDQWTGSWERSAFATGEVFVLVAIEVELPNARGETAEEFRRTFSRDVALHFSRAASSIPQAREARGWMRGDRIVLAVRIAVTSGSRGPSRAEADGAARALADALAQRNLPYTLLTLADPGEWMQGAVLPPV